MIYTTYFAMLKHLPSNIVPISICGKSPSGYHGVQYRKLAPRYGFFQEWKMNHDDAYYVKCYKDQVLSHLCPRDVERELYQISGNTDIALVCYEKPDSFCHRHIVSNWLNENGIESKEYEVHI